MTTDTVPQPTCPTCGCFTRAAAGTWEIACAALGDLRWPVEAGRSAKITFQILQAAAALEEARARHRECERIHAVAVGQWRTRVHQLPRPPRVVQLRQALVGREGLARPPRGGAGRSRRRARVARIGDGHGQAPGDGGRAARDRARPRAAGGRPATSGPAPPRPGYLKVRALARFVDSEGRVHWPDDGAIDWMPDADRDVVIDENKWAELIASD